MPPCRNSPDLPRIRARKQTKCVTSHRTVSKKKTRPNAVRLLPVFSFPLPLFSLTHSFSHLSAGDFSYPEGSSGWTDTSIGSQGWDLYKNSTTKGENALLNAAFVLSHSHHTMKTTYLIFVVCCRGIPACGERPGSAADWGPDPDPSPGPHWPSLHPEL